MTFEYFNTKFHRDRWKQKQSFTFWYCVDNFYPWKDIVGKKVSKLRSIAELRAFYSTDFKLEFCAWPKKGFGLPTRGFRSSTGSALPSSWTSSGLAAPRRRASLWARTESSTRSGWNSGRCGAKFLQGDFFGFVVGAAQEILQIVLN